MELYCVFGIEYHVGKTLLGVYNTREKAELRIVNADPLGYDDVIYKTIELNVDINEEP